MTYENYEASGAKAFDKLVRLLKNRRDTLDSLCNMVDTAQDKVTAWIVLKNARVEYDKAVITMLKDIVDTYYAEGIVRIKTHDDKRSD